MKQIEMKSQGGDDAKLCSAIATGYDSVFRQSSFLFLLRTSSRYKKHKMKIASARPAGYYGSTILGAADRFLLKYKISLARGCSVAHDCERKHKSTRICSM